MKRAKKSMLRTLLGSVREYKLPSILTPLCMIGEVAFECFIPFLMSTRLLGHLEQAHELGVSPDVNYLLIWGGILILCAIMSLTFGSLAGIFAAKASTGFGKNLRKDLYYKLQGFSFKNIDNFSTSSLVTRLTTDVSNVQHAYQMVIRIAVRAPVMMVVSVVFAINILPKVGLIYLISVPFLVIGLALVMIFAMRTFNKIFKKYDALNNTVQENIKGMRVVKAYVREDYERDKFEKSAEDVRRSFTKAEKIVALNNPIMNIAMYTTTTLVLFLCASLGAEFDVTNLSALMSYSVQILMSFMMFSMFFVMLTMAMASGKRITEVLNEESTIVDPVDPLTSVNDGSIEFKNVSFKYSDTSEKFALSDVNVKINSGETIGILGSTGSSKSTLVQLIPRLYDTSEGEVLVGGKNVKDYDLKVLRDSVAMVLQKNVLFSGTVAENVRWGDKDASLDEVKRVCKMACADEFISSFPDGYDTKIEQGGANVSGGQKQRLCIARALLKKPKILILDDSTSAVDTKTDAFIRNSIKNEIPDTTKIIIAQRVASVMDADKIIIMDNGKINAVGTHDELLKNNSIYQEVYYSQTQTDNATKEVNG